MEREDSLSFMMSFLKDFNYPLIHSMNYEEMANVFHISNRCFLVCWALQILDEECYLEILRNREHDIDFLGNLVSKHGFCTENEKFVFFNSDLPVAEQVQILYRMFSFIKRVKKEATIESRVPVTLENIQALINTNLNIFPKFGDIKTLSHKEKLLEINKLQTEIEMLKRSNNNFINKQSNIKTVCQINKSELQNALEKLHENFKQFDRIIKAIGKEKSCQAKSNYKVDPQSEEMLVKCNKYLKLVSQYIEDLQIINTFAVADLQETDEEISQLIEILAEQIRNSFRSI